MAVIRGNLQIAPHVIHRNEFLIFYVLTKNHCVVEHSKRKALTYNVNGFYSAIFVILIGTIWSEIYCIDNYRRTSFSMINKDNYKQMIETNYN